jgi:hypothetical protein
MHDDLLSLLDDWAAKQGEPHPSRPEAIRVLVRMQLEALKGV